MRWALTAPKRRVREARVRRIRRLGAAVPAPIGHRLSVEAENVRLVAQADARGSWVH
jgi:hypothetical protein